ncbi:MAG TPA: ribonuclease HII [Saprospiraceae bacterium]|nr:ribonuclease HII [Saprospiraceae bacterium]
MLSYYKNTLYEAGCDEAGRGPLAGPVYAAAVMLHPDRPILGLNDSKKLNEKQRNALRQEIEQKAMAWVVSSIDPETIDRINILQASLAAMRNCIERLKTKPSIVLVDGNKKIPYLPFEQYCFVKGDGLYESIAAASILAKCYRDDYMLKIHDEFPEYGWNENKGYPTEKHREATLKFGLSIYHRKSFKLKSSQSNLFEE